MFAEASSLSGKARSKMQIPEAKTISGEQSYFTCWIGLGGLFHQGWKGEVDTANKIKIYCCYNILYITTASNFFFRHIPFPVFLWRKNYCLECAPSSFSSKTTKLIQTSGYCRYLAGLPPPHLSPVSLFYRVIKAKLQPCCLLP